MKKKKGDSRNSSIMPQEEVDSEINKSMERPAAGKGHAPTKEKRRPFDGF